MECNCTVTAVIYDAILYLTVDLAVRTCTCTEESILDDDGEYSRYGCAFL
jgi:hypothetical protein